MIIAFIKEESARLFYLQKISEIYIKRESEIEYSVYIESGDERHSVLIYGPSDRNSVIRIYNYICRFLPFRHMFSECTNVELYGIDLRGVDKDETYDKPQVLDSTCNYFFDSRQ